MTWLRLTFALATEPGVLVNMDHVVMVTEAADGGSQLIFADASREYPMKVTENPVEIANRVHEHVERLAK